jgi:RNA polymerase sigma-70 factor (ECF subfamily)
MNPSFSDADLVGRAQAGHLQAFEVLVERHQLRIYRVALRMLGNPADAQDAFLQAWRPPAGFRGDSAFSTWLYRIVTNQCLKFLRDRPRAAPLHELAEAPARRPEKLVEAGARRQAWPTPSPSSTPTSGRRWSCVSSKAVPTRRSLPSLAPPWPR